MWKLQKALFCLSVVVVAVLLFSATVNAIENNEPNNRELELWRESWQGCCKRRENYCLRNSCYFLVPEKTNQASARNGCRGYYPYWPNTTRLLELKNILEKAIVWILSSDIKLSPSYPEDSRPSSFWTSGVQCPEWLEFQGIVTTRNWLSGDPFPEWLLENLNTSMNLDHDCRGLVISLGNRLPELRYEFQNQSNEHAAACQFLGPEDERYTTSTTTTTESLPASTFRENYTETEIEMWRKSWISCCNQVGNICFRDSCYFLVHEWRDQASALNDCRDNYPDWPNSIKLLELKDKDEKETIWLILRGAKLSLSYTAGHRPPFYWTGGFRCENWTSMENSTRTRRWLSGDFFPKWLLNELNTLKMDLEYGCEGLVVSLGKRMPELNYEFQNQSNAHAAVCQFNGPQKERYTTSFTPTTTESLPVTTNHENYTEKELQLWEEEWRNCCRIFDSYCSLGFCYFLTLEKGSQESTLQSCRESYPNWPNNVKLLELKEIHEKEFVWYTLPAAETSKTPESFWTGGLQCEDVVGRLNNNISRIWLSGEPFPNWLLEEVKTLNVLGYGCMGLVISAGKQTEELSYGLQNELSLHAGICQFSGPLKYKYTTTTESPIVTTYGKDHTKTAEKTTEVSSVTTEVPTTLTSEVPSSPPTTWLPNFSDGLFIGCRSRTVEGIHWPDTPPGKTVHRPCPADTIGIAEWTCDARTLTFVPEKPRYENCRHSWLIDMEEEISRGKGDVIAISNRMANKTTSSVLSHGDLSTLVDIMGKLLLLYVKQKFDHVIHEYEAPPSYHLTRAVLTTYSHVLRKDTEQAWTDLVQPHRVKEASKILLQTATIGHHLSCWKKSSDDLQYTVVKENINLQTFILNSVEQREDPYVFPEPTDEPVDVHNKLSLPGNLTIKQWPKSYCEDNVQAAVGIIYKHIGEFLETSNKSCTVVATPVMSYSIGNETSSVKLPEGANVTIDLKHVSLRQQPLLNPRCVFWNFTKGLYGEWDDSGCRTVFTNETHTRCSCNHLTNFAVLMDVGDAIKPGDEVLEMLTYICCGTSAVALVATVICLLSFRNLRSRRSSITCNLCFCLLVADMIVLFGLQETAYEIICSVTAGVLHFFLLSTFCWMLLEGYHLYYMIVVIFSRSAELEMKYFYCFGYGVPTVIVALSASLRFQDYGRKDFCWISNSNGLMWSFVGPACVIMLANLVIFILTMRSALSAKIKKEQDAVRKVKSMLKGSISIMCLLGVTWCVGLLYAIKIFYFSSYVFVVLNGLQGVFIFTFHILLNGKVKSSIQEALCTKRTKPRRIISPTSARNRMEHSPTSSVSSLINNPQSSRKNDQKRKSSTDITFISEQYPPERCQKVYHRVPPSVTPPNKLHSREGMNDAVFVDSRNRSQTSEPSHSVQTIVTNAERRYVKSKNYKLSRETSTNFIK